MQKHEEWLCVAEQDLIAAKKLIIGDNITLGPALSHTQQCAEKALKAYLTYHQQPSKKIHDLVDLIRECSQFDEQFSLLINYAFDLNPYLSTTRYPDDCLILFDHTTVECSIEQAETILQFVKSRIIS